MNARLPALVAASALAVTLSACSGTANEARTTNLPRSTSTGRHAPTISAQTTADRLLQAARAAIMQDHRFSVRALWTNVVPARPVATAGPALVNLRQSVATRRRRGIRIKLTYERFQVVSLRLDPSYARASAVVSDRQHAQPFGRDGNPLGRPVVLNERVRIELRRLGSTDRFVVWKVVPVR